MRSLFGRILATLFTVVPVAAFLKPGLPVRCGRLATIKMAATVEDYRAVYDDLKKLADEKNCGPILVRLAWHDAGTFDVSKKDKSFTERGGANGSIRFKGELGHGANAGLDNAIKLLQPLKDKHSKVGWADLMQAASAASIEVSGGPKIPLRYGRKDAERPEDSPAEGNLPGAHVYSESKPQESFPDGTETPPVHLRKVFHRMGLSDQDIVALSGAHTLGRSHKDRSGAVSKDPTKYTSGNHIARGDNKPGYGKEGGQSWTERWLKFDNSYFTSVYDPNADPELLKFDTDTCLFWDEKFRPFAVKYAENQDAFFQDYSASHTKLSELGVEWEGSPVSIA